MSFQTQCPERMTHISSIPYSPNARLSCLHSLLRIRVITAFCKKAPWRPSVPLTDNTGHHCSTKRTRDTTALTLCHFNLFPVVRRLLIVTSALYFTCYTYHKINTCQATTTSFNILYNSSLQPCSSLLYYHNARNNYKQQCIHSILLLLHLLHAFHCILIQTNK